MDLAKVEYELQLFKFSADDMVAQNEQLVKYLIQCCYHSFTQEFIVQHKIPDDVGYEMNLKSYMTSLQIFKECMPKVKEISALFKKTFSVPDNILLPTDLLHRKEYTEEQLVSLQTKVKELEQQIRQDGVFLSMLEEEIELHEKLASCVENEEKFMDLVEHHRQMEIVPAEDCAVVQDLADVMKEVMRMK